MADTPDSEPEAPSADDSLGEGVGDALRAAVERTLSATAGSATETRQRGKELLDDVVRRGVSARERVSRRGEEATARIAGALGDLRTSEPADAAPLDARLTQIERRVAELERAIVGYSNPQVEDQSSPGSGGRGT
jgi:polyhydroxyalkanoate synthesis regulator phasin